MLENIARVSEEDIPPPPAQQDSTLSYMQCLPILRRLIIFKQTVVAQKTMLKKSLAKFKKLNL
ncbi:MAG: hypothetical protein M1150_00620 [Patescibacteria group bacterium]|nr:hypothetical protein [Patescibacteria group bacterium]